MVPIEVSECAGEVQDVGKELLVVRHRSGGVRNGRYVAEFVTASERILAFVPECQRPDVAAGRHPTANNRPGASNSTLKHLDLLTNELSARKIRCALVQREVHCASIAGEEVDDVEAVGRTRCAFPRAEACPGDPSLPARAVSTLRKEVCGQDADGRSELGFVVAKPSGNLVSYELAALIHRWRVAIVPLRLKPKDAFELCLHPRKDVI